MYLLSKLFLSFFLFFFFSSRRRHTRFDCDWSSDVVLFRSDSPEGVLGGNPRGLYGTSSSISILKPWAKQIIRPLQAQAGGAEKGCVREECRSRGWPLPYKKKTNRLFSTRCHHLQTRLLIGL